MIKYKLHTTQSIFKFVFFFLFLQIGNSAIGQTINLPVYTINKTNFDSILAVKDDKSKLTANIRIEDSSLDFTQKSSLYLFAFHKKGANSGDRKFTIYVNAKIYTTTPIKYFPFLLTNTEEKIKKIKDTLATVEHKDYKSLVFVPELKQIDLPDGKKIYNLTFVIYTSKETKEDLDKNTNFAQMKLLLKKAVQLNPCPPARPADY
jgi:hypothetical protein